MRRSSDTVNRPLASPQLSADDAGDRAVVITDLRYLVPGSVLVVRRRHLQRGGQVCPQLKPVHGPFRRSFRHLLMDDAAARRHPLHGPRAQNPGVAQAILVLHAPGENVRNGLNTSVGMPGESGLVVLSAIVSEIIEKKKGVEHFGLSESERATKPNAGSLHRWGRLPRVGDRSYRHLFTSELKNTSFPVRRRSRSHHKRSDHLINRSMDDNVRRTLQIAPVAVTEQQRYAVY